MTHSRRIASPLVLCAALLLPGFAAALPRAFDKQVPESVRELQEIQDHVQQVVEKVAPATVGLRIGQAQGSGVIISKDGHVLTAGHVSGEPGRKVIILLPDGRKLTGITLGANAGIDSGLVKITDEGATFPHVEMATSADLKKGQWCLAIGHPGGYQVGRAPVVRLGRILEATDKLVRTDCPLVGGDSGGPLFDMNGKVIGVHSRIGGAITFNIHVPVDTYRDTWDRLVASETWGKAPFFSLTRSADAYLGVRADAEAKVLTVAPDSPAAKAGLKIDDVILQVDGKKITSFEELGQVLRGKRPGNQIAVHVRRGDATQVLNVTLGKRPT